MDNRMCTPLLREINQEKVRRFLMEFQTCTKMDIASQLGMSHPTVGKILSEMEKNGEVRYVGKETSLGGRPSEQYRLNPDFSHAMVIAMGMEKMIWQVINLAKEIQEEHIVQFEEEKHLQQMEEAISQAQKAYPTLRTVSIGVPGNVDNGKIMFISDENYLVGKDIAPVLQQKCHISVEIYNDVNAMALGYYVKHIEVSLKKNSLAYLYWSSTGPGAGFIVNGAILNGFSGFAGEVSAVYPKQKYPFAQIQSYVSAIIAILNPRYLILSHSSINSVDENALRQFVEEEFPPHSRPQIYFSDEHELNFIDGLHDLAVQSMAPKILF